MIPVMQAQHSCSPRAACQSSHLRMRLGAQGLLKGFDQTTNIVLTESHERVYST